jgi:hypothetical protein
MNTKKVIGGILLIIAGVVLGLFVSLYVCMYGGIVQLIHGFQAPGGIDASAVAFGVMRLAGGGVLGGLSALFLISPGVVSIFYGLKNKENKKADVDELSPFPRR